MGAEINALWFDAVTGVFWFLECEKEGQEVDIVQHLFPDHLVFVRLHLPNMLDFSEWRDASAHVSRKRVQRGGRDFATEWS